MAELKNLMKRAIEFATQSTDPLRASVNGPEVNNMDIEEMAVDTNQSMLVQETTTQFKSGQQAEVVDLVDTSAEDVSFRKIDSCQTETEEEIVCLSSDDDEISIVAESSRSTSSSRTLRSMTPRRSGPGSSSGDYWSEEDDDDVAAHPVTFINYK